MRRLLLVVCLGLAPALAGAASLRLVSLAPHLTEWAFALGRGDAVAAVTRQCDLPPEVKGLRTVGDYMAPSFEEILGVAPTLVLAPTGTSALVQRLRSRGIEVWWGDWGTLAAVRRSARALAVRLDRVEAGLRLTRPLEAPPPGVTPRCGPAAALVQVDPPVLAGQGSFLGELVARVFPLIGPRDMGYQTWALESFLGKGLQHLVLPRGQAGRFGRSSLARLGAKLVFIEDALLLRPGPRLGEVDAALRGGCS